MTVGKSRIGGRVFLFCLCFPIACSPDKTFNQTVCSPRRRQGLTFPPEAGFPVDSTKERFYLMETRYSNREAANATAEPTGSGEHRMHVQAQTDNSGLRLHVSAALRPHDAGFLSLGEYGRAVCRKMSECMRMIFAESGGGIECWRIDATVRCVEGNRVDSSAFCRIQSAANGGIVRS